MRAALYMHAMLQHMWMLVTFMTQVKSSFLSMAAMTQRCTAAININPSFPQIPKTVTTVAASMLMFDEIGIKYKYRQSEHLVFVGHRGRVPRASDPAYLQWLALCCRRRRRRCCYY